ncbi:MAG TPA: hypothetical protein VKH45_00595, partial [Candidatus Acidoferrum sp.]|nr:hypothetical protein [Candidatus Acidoferrum sp.]
MNKRFSLLLRSALCASLCFLLFSRSALAQSPEGPQTSAPPQADPKLQPKAPAPQEKKPEDAGVTIAVEVPVVTLDVIATTTNGDIIPGLKKENFRILEDGQPQSITNFAPSEAPITMVLLLEFSNVFSGWFSGEAKYWSEALFPNLNQKDWVALVTYDMKPHMEVDFTQNKDELRQAV